MFAMWMAITAMGRAGLFCLGLGIYEVGLILMAVEAGFG